MAANENEPPNFRRGHTVLLLWVCVSLRESSGTNTSHIVPLFSFFFVSSIQRNMAEMCNYLFEALCFQQVWNMCTSSPPLFLFISIRLLFLTSILSSPSFFLAVTHCFSLLPLIFPLSSFPGCFLSSHTRLSFLPFFKVVYLLFAPSQNNNSLLTSISPASFSFQLCSSHFSL